MSEGAEVKEEVEAVAPVEAPRRDRDEESGPSFARDFPRDADLQALVAAFTAGDFARVKEGVPRLVASAKDEPVKTAARLLLARTRPDPLAALLVVVTALLLFALSAWWIAHSGKR